MIIRDHRGPIHEGQKPMDSGLTNRSTASGWSMLQLAFLLHSALMRRLRCHLGWGSWASQVEDPGSAIRVLFETTPNATLMRFRIGLTPVRYDAAAQPAPELEIFLKNLSLGATAETSQGVFKYHYRDDNIGPINYGWIDLECAVQPGSAYELRIEQRDLVQMFCCTVREEPRYYLNPATDVAADMSDYAETKQILDGQLQDFWDAMQRAFDELGGVLFTWCPHGEGDRRSIPISTASLVNIFNTAVAGWSGSELGAWCWPQAMGTYETDDLEVVIWVVVEFSATQSVNAIGRQVSFVASGSFGSTLGTIDIQGYGPGSALSGLIALSTRWTGASGYTDALVQILAKNPSSAEAFLIRAAGMYARGQFDPRSISSLSVWLAADKITGLVDGNSVTTWPDKSGNGFDAGQATAGNKPTYKTGIISGKPVVRFDGTTDYMTVADASGYKATALTVFVVATQTPASGFPTIVGTPVATATASSTSHVVTLPGSLVVGQALIVVFHVANASAVTWPAGWTSIVTASVGSSNREAAAYRVVDGTEGATITITTGSAAAGRAHAFQIAGHACSTQAPEGASATASASANPNPPNLTPTGGAKNYLWIASGGGQSQNITADPASFTNILNGSGSVPRLRTAYRQTNAASLDPAVFTAAAMDNVALTIAVHPGLEGLGPQGLVGYPHDATSAGYRWGLTVDPSGNDTLRAWANNASNSVANAYANIPRVWTYDVAAAQVWRDGTSKADNADPGSITYPTAVGLYVGASADLATNTGAFWAGDIAEIIVYGRQLTAAERGSVELYLKMKYGLVQGRDWNA